MNKAIIGMALLMSLVGMSFASGAQYNSSLSWSYNSVTHTMKIIEMPTPSVAEPYGGNAVVGFATLTISDVNLTTNSSTVNATVISNNAVYSSPQSNYPTINRTMASTACGQLLNYTNASIRLHFLSTPCANLKVNETLKDNSSYVYSNSLWNASINIRTGIDSLNASLNKTFYVVGNSAVSNSLYGLKLVGLDPLINISKSFTACGQNVTYSAPNISVRVNSVPCSNENVTLPWGKSVSFPVIGVNVLALPLTDALNNASDNQKFYGQWLKGCALGENVTYFDNLTKLNEVICNELNTTAPTALIIFPQDYYQNVVVNALTTKQNTINQQSNTIINDNTTLNSDAQRIYNNDGLNQDFVNGVAIAFFVGAGYLLLKWRLEKNLNANIKKKGGFQ